MNTRRSDASRADSASGESAAVENHWADRHASQVDPAVAHPVVCTGISPSGPFHVGHLREVITGDALARALREAGRPAKMVFVVDNVDPLRKVYPFLDTATFEPLVGQSLNRLPAPEGSGSYDRYFLEPFLQALDQLGVECEVLPASELYGSGRMDGVVFDALEKRDVIARILQEVTGREVGEHWSPWNGACGLCHKLDRTRVVGFDRAAGTISSSCGHCKKETDARPSDGGKLTWRVDWPARWKVLGVTVEPFGKDHSSKGGSYDTGTRIASEVYGIQAPFPVIYEWISLKGQGDMSSSRGNVLTVEELVTIVPPEVLRYLVLKARPQRGIAFDPGLPLLRLVDEVDDASTRGRDDRALQLSQAGRFSTVGVPFKHLVLVAQIARFDLDKTLEILARGGYRDLDRAAVEARMAMARRWLERFAPDEARVEFQDELPEAVRELDSNQRRFLAELAQRLPGMDDPEQIHNAIYELAKQDEAMGPKRGFQAIYRTLIGKDRGPRAGFFIAILGPETVARRFEEVGRMA